MGTTFDSDDEYSNANRQNWRARLDDRTAPTPTASAPEQTVHVHGSSEPDEPKETGRRKKEAPTTAADFTGPLVPLQVKLPQDLVQSLKLHAIAGNETMGDIVLRCLTSETMVGKAWISTRRSA